MRRTEVLNIPSVFQKRGEFFKVSVKQEWSLMALRGVIVWSAPGSQISSVTSTRIAQPPKSSRGHFDTAPLMP